MKKNYLSVALLGHSGGKEFQFGLGFELYKADKKPVPKVSNTALHGADCMGLITLLTPTTT